MRKPVFFHQSRSNPEGGVDTWEARPSENTILRVIQDLDFTYFVETERYGELSEYNEQFELLSDAQKFLISKFRSDVA